MAGARMVCFYLTERYRWGLASPMSDIDTSNVFLVTSPDSIVGKPGITRKL